MYLTIEEFGNRMIASGLVTAEELTAFLRSLPSPPVNGQAFAKALVEHGKLSQTQAGLLWAGDTIRSDQAAGSGGQLPDVQEDNPSSPSVIGSHPSPPVASPETPATHNAREETDRPGSPATSAPQAQTPVPPAEAQAVPIHESQPRRKWFTRNILMVVAIAFVVITAIGCLLWDRSVALEASQAHRALFRKLPARRSRRNSRAELLRPDVEKLIGKISEGDVENFERSIIVAYRWQGLLTDHVLYVLYKKVDSGYSEEELVFAGLGLNEKPKP